MNVRVPKHEHPISEAADLYPIMQKILLRENKHSRSQERFYIIGLSSSAQILFIELVGLGKTNRVNVDPTTLYRLSVQKNVGRVILVHNHPSGNLTPSEADINSTDYHYKCGRMLDVEVVDHLIIDEKDYFSFSDKGLIDQVKKSGLYEVIKAETVRLMELMFEEKKAMKIAAKLKAEGMDIDFIKRVTGLRKSDIEKA